MDFPGTNWDVCVCVCVYGCVRVFAYMHVCRTNFTTHTPLWRVQLIGSSEKSPVLHPLSALNILPVGNYNMQH